MGLSGQDEGGSQWYRDGVGSQWSGWGWVLGSGWGGSQWYRDGVGLPKHGRDGVGLCGQDGEGLSRRDGVGLLYI